MPATMQQPTIHQVDASEPSQLVVTVKVTRGSAPGTFQHDVTALTAAGPTGSQWIVTWTLAASSDLWVKFKNPGVIRLSIPGGVKDPDISGTTTQQRLTFTNDVTDVNVIRYDLDLDVEDKGGKLMQNVVFDPTIAVIKDPLDPPAV